MKYCDLCKHWFCSRCRREYFWRGLAAVREFVGGPREGCCGPEACHICEMRNG